MLFTRYYSGNKIKTTEMGRARSMYGARRGAYRILVGKPEGRRPLGRPRRRWRIILKWILSNVGWVMDWMDLA